MSKIELIKVSRDNGLNWTEEEVDVKELHPDKSTLKVGDLIERNGMKFEIFLSVNNRYERLNNMLQAKYL